MRVRATSKIRPRMTDRRNKVIYDTRICDEMVVSDIAFHTDMAELIFCCYWSGRNELQAAKWAVDFIMEHQGIKHEGNYRHT